jgi:hypothetical protein
LLQFIHFIAIGGYDIILGSLSQEQKHTSYGNRTRYYKRPHFNLLINLARNRARLRGISAW